MCITQVSVCFAADAPKVERLLPPGGQLGTAVEYRVKGKAGDGDLQVWSSRGELQFELSEKHETATVKIPAEATPGLHWLRFYNENGATDLQPFLVGTVPELPEVEPNNRLNESQPVDVPTVTINGVLEKSEDADLFQIALSAGQTFVASVEANSQLGSPIDAVLQILDARGTVVSQNNDDRGLDPQIEFKVPADGVYHVRLFAFPSKPNSTIKLSAGANHVYRLTLTTEAFANHTIPAVMNSETDNFVRVIGPGVSQEKMTVASLADSNGKVVLSEGIALPIEIERVLHANHVETPGESVEIEIPSSITGTIAGPGEEDTFTLRAKKGQRLTATVAARSLHSHLDPVVAVRSADGKVVKESDDRARGDLDAEALVKIPADGQYTVAVSDRYGFGGHRYFYVLTCEETEPEFAATLNTNHFELTGDQPLEVSVTVVRSNGFAGDIEFGIRNLPPGVAARTCCVKK